MHPPRKRRTALRSMTSPRGAQGPHRRQAAAVHQHPPADAARRGGRAAGRLAGGGRTGGDFGRGWTRESGCWPVFGRRSFFWAGCVPKTWGKKTEALLRAGLPLPGPGPRGGGRRGFVGPWQMPADARVGTEFLSTPLVFWWLPFGPPLVSLWFPCWLPFGFPLVSP